MIKKIVIGVVLASTLVYVIHKEVSIQTSPQQQINTDIKNQETTVISTSPSTLDNTTVLPGQTISVTFNNPLMNKDEFKFRLEPNTPLKIMLSSDNKTVNLTPVSSYTLGGGYTFFIKPDSNFLINNQKTPLGKEIIFHFKTIKYKGV